MWTRNWDNLQIMQQLASVEAISPTYYGDNSLSLKDVRGKILPGDRRWFIYSNLSPDSLYGTGRAASLSINEPWNNGFSYADLEKASSYTDTNYAVVGPINMMAFGYENDEINYNDYSLSEITTLTNVSYTIYPISKDINSDIWSLVISRTVKNTTNEDININCLGIYKSIFYDTTGAKNWGDLYTRNLAGVFLIYKEKINAVTIRPNETHTFSIKIDFATNAPKSQD